MCILMKHKIVLLLEFFVCLYGIRNPTAASLPSDFIVVTDKENGTNWYEARKQCLELNAELASITNEQELADALNAMIAKGKTYKSDGEMFLGAKNGLYTSAMGNQPWNKDSFEWSIEEKMVLMNNYTITSKLWDKGQPDNKEPLEQCTVIYTYMPSGKQTLSLAMGDIQCREKKGYLCRKLSPQGMAGRRSKSAKSKG